MIVNYTTAGWQVITQRSHGLLAAQVCARWKKSNQPSRWLETLIATAEHDDVYNEFDNTELLDGNGAPLNFKALEFDHQKTQKLIDMAETKSAYIALLISKHIQFVYGPDPKSANFIKTLKKIEKKWIDIAQITRTEIEKSYALLEFCDALSLLLCQGMVQPEGRKIEIGNGPDHQRYDMYMQKDRLMISPWPFEENSFDISYESRTIEQLSFKDSASFSLAIKAVKALTHTLKLSKS